MECSRCQKFGVNCESKPLGEGSLVYIDGEMTFATKELIKECPARAGERTFQEMATGLRNQRLLIGLLQ